MKKTCKHEYRIVPKTYNDTSTNEGFYCIHCLSFICVHFYSLDKCIKNPTVTTLSSPHPKKEIGSDINVLTKEKEEDNE